MTVSPTYCLQGIGNTKVSITPEGLRSIFFQTEAELHRSEAYQRALSGLQKSADAAEGLQALVKSVGREAIRLALRQLVKQYHAAPTAAQVTLEATANPFDASTIPNAILAAEPSALEAPLRDIPRDVSAYQIVDAAPQADEAQLDKVTPADAALAPSTELPTEAAKPTSRHRFQPQPTAQQLEREAILRQVGQKLKQVRQAKSLSVEHLYNQTWVPTYQLKALEAGQVEQLPEDIYVRGFIRRIGDALGLNGADLASSIPALDPIKSVVPSWARSPEPPSLSPIHLYVGYAALMAGAVGGLAWMTHQPVAVDGHWSFDQPKSVSQSTREMKINPTTHLNAEGTIAQPNIAPPENMPF